MTSLQHKRPWGLPCWATCPINNRVPIPMESQPPSTHGHLPCLSSRITHHCILLIPSLQQQRFQCFYTRNPLSWKKTAWNLQSRETHLNAPGMVCRSKQPISWLQEPGYAQRRSSRDNLPSASSTQTSETLSLPGEIIKETKKRKGGMQTACFQFRKKKPGISEQEEATAASTHAFEGHQLFQEGLSF